MPEEDKTKIRIEYRTNVDDSVKSALQETVENIVEILPSITSDDFSDPLLFDTIIVIEEDSQLLNTTNHIISEIAKSTKTYRAPQDIPSALTIPVEVNSTLVNYIIIKVNTVTDGLVDGGTKIEFLSTMFEELIHARIYSINYQTRGYVSKNDPTIRNDLFIIASMIHDEHMTSRIKAPVIKLLSNGILTYGNDVNKLLNESYKEILKAYREYKEGQINIRIYWQSISNITYRKIFEPLSRDYGLKKGNDIEYSSIFGSMFYQKYISKYWDEMRALLDESIGNKLGNMEEIANKMVDILITFLNNIGIYFNQDVSNIENAINERIEGLDEAYGEIK